MALLRYVNFNPGPNPKLHPYSGPCPSHNSDPTLSQHKLKLDAMETKEHKVTYFKEEVKDQNFYVLDPEATYFQRYHLYGDSDVQRLWNMYTLTFHFNGTDSDPDQDKYMTIQSGYPGKNKEDAPKEPIPDKNKDMWCLRPYPNPDPNRNPDPNPKP